jgi:osmotically inducible protein OsmC
MVQRRADVIWEKDLLSGKGSVTVGSGSFREFPVTWVSRAEDSGGKTSPEELLAAAHASCYAMALSGTLARRKTPPQRLDVTAICSFEKQAEGWKVTTSELTVTGRIIGLDQAGFEDAARVAEKSCPISNAIRNNVEIRLSAKLA